MLVYQRVSSKNRWCPMILGHFPQVRWYQVIDPQLVPRFIALFAAGWAIRTASGRSRSRFFRHFSAPKKGFSRNGFLTEQWWSNIFISYDLELEACWLMIAWRYAIQDWRWSQSPATLVTKALGHWVFRPTPWPWPTEFGLVRCPIAVTRDLKPQSSAAHLDSILKR